MSRKPDLDPGNTSVLLKSLHGMRGIFANYTNCNPMWKTFAGPIGDLVDYADLFPIWARCGDSEFWMPVWNMIAILRRLSQVDQTWKNLVAGTLLGLLHSKVRFAWASTSGNVMWFSGDAALARASCVNWDAEGFICLPLSDLVDHFIPRHQQGLIIADIELLPMVLSLVVWGSAVANSVLLVVSGNANALSWMTKKRAENGHVSASFRDLPEMGH